MSVVRSIDAEHGYHAAGAKVIYELQEHVTLVRGRWIMPSLHTHLSWGLKAMEVVGQVIYRHLLTLLAGP